MEASTPARRADLGHILGVSRCEMGFHAHAVDFCVFIRLDQLAVGVVFVNHRSCVILKANGRWMRCTPGLSVFSHPCKVVL